MQSSKLTHILSFGLDIYTSSSDDLQKGCLEARRIHNETNRLDRAGWEWSDIKRTVWKCAVSRQVTRMCSGDETGGIGDWWRSRLSRTRFVFGC